MKKNILVYLFMLFITYCFTYIFDCPEGYYLLYIILFIPLIDLISIVFVRRKISIKMKILENQVHKDDFFNVNISIQNKGILPVVSLRFSLDFNNILYSGIDHLERISLGSMEKKNITYKFKAHHVGKGLINLEKLEVCGVFDIFVRRVNVLASSEILIEPRILNIKNFESSFESKISDMSGIYQSNEYSSIHEEFDSEYRNYIEGEPINHINWKLYSKSGILLSRKNSEYISRENVTVILDPSFIDCSYENAKYDELVEVFISIVNYLFKHKEKVKVFMFFSDEPKNFKIDSKSDIDIIRSELSTYNFVHSHSNNICFDNMHINLNDLCIVVTSNIPFKFENIEVNNKLRFMYIGDRQIAKNALGDNNICCEKVIGNDCIIERY